MCNLQPASRASSAGSLDGLHFSNHGSRVQVIACAGAAGIARAPREPRRDLLALGVDRDRQSQPRRFAHAFVQREIVRARKFRQARIAEEGLEADHAAFRQRRQLAEVARHDSAPQREVRDGGAFQRRALLRKGRAIDGARRRVERHIEEGRAAPRCQRPASRRRAFPVGAARFVEVQVIVDHSGEDSQPARIDLTLRAGKLASRWPRSAPRQSQGRRTPPRPPGRACLRAPRTHSYVTRGPCDGASTFAACRYSSIRAATVRERSVI